MGSQHKVSSGAIQLLIEVQITFRCSQNAAAAKSAKARPEVQLKYHSSPGWLSDLSSGKMTGSWPHCWIRVYKHVRHGGWGPDWQ